MRWSLVLSCYDFTISYVLGKENVQADALSRKEQDMLKNIDERTEYRTTQLLKPSTLKNLCTRSIRATLVQLARDSNLDKEEQTVAQDNNLDEDLSTKKLPLEEL